MSRFLKTFFLTILLGNNLSFSSGKEGIEPTILVLETNILPLNYSPIVLLLFLQFLVCLKLIVLICSN